MITLGETQNDLVNKAEQLEEQAFKTSKTLLSQISALADVIEDVYTVRRPTSYDYKNREDLIRIFNVVAKEIYGNQQGSPTVEEFGSFLMNMFDSRSDLDLSINFNHNDLELSRQRKIKTLRNFTKKFNILQRRGHVKKVQAILTARVPVLKVTDCGTGIECDISVENRDGIAKSHIILMISAIDERFQKLCFMVKAWAKSQGINSSKDGTLNSLSLVSLVAFHLQKRDPPILPPFSEIFKDGTDPATVKDALPKFLKYGERNNESLAELFVTFLIRLESVKTLWAEGLCASAYQGSWIRKTWAKKIGCITVEDFTIRALNLARALSPGRMSDVYQRIHDSLHCIQDFVDGKMDRSKLRDSLFGPDHLVDDEGIIKKFDPIEVEQPAVSASKENGLIEEGSGVAVDKPDETSGGISSNANPASSDEGKKVSDITPGLGIRNGALDTGKSLSNPTSHSNSSSKNKRKRSHRPASKSEGMQQYHGGYSGALPLVNPQFILPAPSMPPFQPYVPIYTYPSHIIPPAYVVDPRLMGHSPLNQNFGAPHLYPPQLDVERILWYPNQ
ncbi:hypothetical protein Dimus_010188 [Dionaea muscipula]